MTATQEGCPELGPRDCAEWNSVGVAQLLLWRFSNSKGADMKKVPTVLTELRKTNLRLAQQGEEIASLRASADIQFKRMAQIQAELDALPAARERRSAVRTHLTLALPPANRNGKRAD
jgi:hypothetical protein